MLFFLGSQRSLPSQLPNPLGGAHRDRGDGQ
jgi:hypothetical protein